MNCRYELPNDISGWVKYLAKSNATVVKSPAGPTLRTARNSANSILPASKARQTVAKMLVEQFGTIEEVSEEIGKIKRGKGEGLIDRLISYEALPIDLRKRISSARTRAALAVKRSYGGLN